MISWFIHRIQRQTKLERKIQLSFKFVLLSVAGVMVLVLTVGTVMFGKLVDEGYANYWKEQALKSAMGQVESMVKDMANRIDAMVPQGTAIGPDMDPKAQERVKDLIRETTDGPNGYYFMFDREGRVIAQRIQQDREGTTRFHAVDTDGKLYVQKLIEAAKQGGGFVEYKMVKPNQEGNHPKLSYAKMLRGDQWWVGSGFYLDDIDTNVQAMKRELWFKIWIITLLIIVFVGGLVLGALRLSRILTQQITEPIRKLVVGANTLSSGEYGYRVEVDTQDELKGLGEAFNDMAKTIGQSMSNEKAAREESEKYLEQHRAATEKERTLVEEERKRIAMELHDDIVEKLLELRKDVESAQIAAADESHHASLVGIIQSITNINDRIREMLQDLRPRALDDLGLLAALRVHLKKQAESARITLGYHDQVGELSLSPEVEINVFRIFQQAMANVVEHADARRVDVWIRSKGKMLEVCLQDDGQGFDDDARIRRPGGHFGLINMKERGRSFGGTVEIVSGPSVGGTRVEVSIPLAHSV